MIHRKLSIFVSLDAAILYEPESTRLAGCSIALWTALRRSFRSARRGRVHRIQRIIGTLPTESGCGTPHGALIGSQSGCPSAEGNSMVVNNDEHLRSDTPKFSETVNLMSTSCMDFGAESITMMIP